MFLRLCSRAPVSSSHLLERASATTSCEALSAAERFSASALAAAAVFSGERLGLATAQVFACQRFGLALYLARSAEKYDFATLLTGTGAHVENAIGLQHDLRIVFHDHQRVACVAHGGGSVAIKRSCSLRVSS